MPQSKDQVVSYTYRPSGKCSPILLLIVVICILVGAGLGAAYQYFLFYNPLLFFNFLVCIIMAWISSLIANVLILQGHSRNYCITGIASLIFAISVISSSHYVSFRLINKISYVERERIVIAATRSGLSLEQVKSLINTSMPSFMTHLKNRIEDGWSLGSLKKYSQGENLSIFNHHWVLLVWFIEFAIFVVSVVTLVSRSVDIPYCEECLCWANNKLEVAEYFTLNSILAKQIKEATSLSELVTKPNQNLLKASGLGETSTIRYTLELCPVCERFGTLNIMEEIPKVNRDGQEKIARNIIWSKLVLDIKSIDSLLKNNF